MAGRLVGAPQLRGRRRQVREHAQKTRFFRVESAPGILADNPECAGRSAVIVKRHDEAVAGGGF